MRPSEIGCSRLFCEWLVNFSTNNDYNHTNQRTNGATFPRSHFPLTKTEEREKKTLFFSFIHSPFEHCFESTSDGIWNGLNWTSDLITLPLVLTFIWNHLSIGSFFSSLLHRCTEHCWNVRTLSYMTWISLHSLSEEMLNIYYYCKFHL